MDRALVVSKPGWLMQRLARALVWRATGALLLLGTVAGAGVAAQYVPILTPPGTELPTACAVGPTVVGYLNGSVDYEYCPADVGAAIGQGN
ncbi:MAG: hypothetical protein KGL39_35760 [Patescibacteria group bacterium]|nr:hypothetical protein [Patescibacteria group bacterium]